VWEGNSFSIDLLLTDLVMPGGMSGLELAEQLLSLQPRLRVLYTSGYSHDVVGKSISLDRETNFLHKPFSIVELATLVRRCLDAPRK
jgi:DNA-binding NtrC family response regulator